MRITDIFDAVRDGTYFDFMDFYSGNPNLFNKYAGMSLLQLSVVNDRYPDEKIKILRFLISEGADVNFLSPKDQRNALHIFYFSVLRPEPQYMLKITQLLIAAGVDINKKDKFKLFPAKMAIHLNLQSQNQHRPVGSFQLHVSFPSVFQIHSMRCTLLP